ncbi:unnamed protein product [Ectocarpus sp. 4 AP-2014]
MGVVAPFFRRVKGSRRLLHYNFGSITLSSWSSSLLLLLSGVLQEPAASLRRRRPSRFLYREQCLLPGWLFGFWCLSVARPVSPRCCQKGCVQHAFHVFWCPIRLNPPFLQPVSPRVLLC